MQQEAIETYDHAWERLVKATVHRAIYNAEPRGLSPCLESTRTTVLQSIRQVVDEKSQKNVWLHGFPGSGKTSILFTIAEELRAQGRLAGTFFFSHNSVDTTICDYIVPTLAYQLALAFPSVKSEIIRAVADDPALLSDLKSRQDQIQRLIIKHLWRLQFRSPVAFIIDALDESCSPLEAVRVARLLAEAIRAYRVLDDKPLDAHIIIASRPSLHVDGGPPGRLGFGDIQKISLQDDDWETRTDIRLFLACELQHVVKSRKLSLGDVPQWPSPRQMDNLAAKVGNSFLCASIAMKYIAHPKKYPPSRLDAFLTSPGATADAYVDLDHTYQEIISGNSALIRHLIDIVNLAQPLPRSQLLQFFPSDKHEGLNLALEEFSSILIVSSGQPTIPIQPYHSSLIEFFADPMRCHAHYIEPAEIHRGLALQCFVILHKLKANLCGLSDHTTMAVEDSHFWHTRDAMLPESTQYACRNWAHHLSHANDDKKLVSALEQFLRVHILHWIEALCLLGELSDGPIILRKARAAVDGWAPSMQHRDFTLINRSLATAEQIIILYFDPISLFPLQVYYIVAALANLSGKRLHSKSNVLVHKCGPTPDSVYQFPVSGLRTSLVNPGPSQGQSFNRASSDVSGVLADCCRWLSNSELGAFHLSDLNVTLDSSFRNLDDPPVDLEGYLLDLCRPHLALRWVCLQIISETSQEVSTSIQPIAWHTHGSRVEFDSMTILADADHRCRLRVLVSASKTKPSKPGIILGEWLFNFRSLMEHADSNNKLRLCMYDGTENPSNNFGNLSCTVGTVPAFSTSKHGQIVGQFPGPHSSNSSPGIFTAPLRLIPRPHLSNASPGIPIAPLDLTKKSGDSLFPAVAKRLDDGFVTASQAGPSFGLPSVLDFNLTFKEPDEYEMPDPPLIRQTRMTTLFHDLKRTLRVFKFRNRHSIDHT
ncbi:hypothetical protein DEU56DRAFT_883819 [Suillus clintonianus]|uniref:uncharacterized protein n=1 Tax=Suillus clintonianus TaxID=1904413 RepID=UPI001B86BF22|nr:uncharacterized protein DEU56DRAFT_883819 [Suillus clintonianus]KAG2144493.1 hypothetical protein DEU56DRAFT_883819 [Suillus clintonianus]